MDRDEALKLLRGGPEGIEEWNKKRDDGEKIPPLIGVNLCHANLNNVNLSRCNLRGAKLCGAHIHDANLNCTDLRDARLNEAVLLNTKLIDVNLHNSDFNNSYVGWTVFSSDLSNVKNIDTVTHYGPSIVDMNSLISMKGKLPEKFLRGCGVSEVLIEYLPSLRSSIQPIEYYSCFISYCHEDEEFAKRLHARMQQEGLRVWFAPEDLKAGKKIHEQIDEGIRLYDKLLLVLSPESMKSNWVEREIRKARDRERKESRKMFFPISITAFSDIKEWKLLDADEGRDLAAEIREYQIPDFQNWKQHDAFEKAFARLLRDLKTD